MKTKISVILPSLNVVQYIRECVESVLRQSLSEIEIICVDAGSTDGTLEILHEYERSDDRVSVIISDKKSYGFQMNIGIKVARGEYIGIVETDDYVPKEMYADMYMVAKEYDVDFIKADFYRFFGEGKNLCKARVRLSKDSDFYNRVIDIKEEQECFKFPINTWSGIYKKEFLLGNGIWHNETPGASYQDNGFWFQTFVHAKRAYFMQKPYYMNRRDNPNSSVYSKGKVLCICDEYKYILDVLKNSNLLECFGDVYVKACYEAYRGHFNRVSEEFKVIFLGRFSKDFRMLQLMGILRESLFAKSDWKFISSIIGNPQRYYEDNQKLKEAICDELAQFDKVIIYGAGMVGRRLYQELQASNQTANIICFAVSDKAENFDIIDGVAIKSISELVEYRNSLVVIATTEVYQKEIKENLVQLGFKNIIPVPECIFM